MKKLETALVFADMTAHRATLGQNRQPKLRTPMMTASHIHYEIADRTQATSHGGIGAIHLLMRKLGLDQAINEGSDC